MLFDPLLAELPAESTDFRHLFWSPSQGDVDDAWPAEIHRQEPLVTPQVSMGAPGAASCAPGAAPPQPDVTNDELTAFVRSVASQEKLFPLGRVPLHQLGAVYKSLCQNRVRKLKDVAIAAADAGLAIFGDGSESANFGDRWVQRIASRTAHVIPATTTADAQVSFTEALVFLRALIAAEARPFKKILLGCVGPMFKLQCPSVKLRDAAIAAKILGWVRLGPTNPGGDRQIMRLVPLEQAQHNGRRDVITVPQPQRHGSSDLPTTTRHIVSSGPTQLLSPRLVSQLAAFVRSIIDCENGVRFRQVLMQEVGIPFKTRCKNGGKLLQVASNAAKAGWAAMGGGTELANYGDRWVKRTISFEALESAERKYLGAVGHQQSPSVSSSQAQPEQQQTAEDNEFLRAPQLQPYLQVLVKSKQAGEVATAAAAHPTTRVVEPAQQPPLVTPSTGPSTGSASRVAQAPAVDEVDEHACRRPVQPTGVVFSALPHVSVQVGSSALHQNQLLSANPFGSATVPAAPSVHPSWAAAAPARPQQVPSNPALSYPGRGVEDHQRGGEGGGSNNTTQPKLNAVPQVQVGSVPLVRLSLPVGISSTHKAPEYAADAARAVAMLLSSIVDLDGGILGRQVLQSAVGDAFRKHQSHWSFRKVRDLAQHSQLVRTGGESGHAWIARISPECQQHQVLAIDEVWDVRNDEFKAQQDPPAKAPPPSSPNQQHNTSTTMVSQARSGTAVAAATLRAGGSHNSDPNSVGFPLPNSADAKGPTSASMRVLSDSSRGPISTAPMANVHRSSDEQAQSFLGLITGDTELARMCKLATEVREFLSAQPRGKVIVLNFDPDPLSERHLLTFIKHLGHHGGGSSVQRQATVLLSPWAPARRRRALEQLMQQQVTVKRSAAVEMAAADGAPPSLTSQWTRISPSTVRDRNMAAMRESTQTASVAGSSGKCDSAAQKHSPTDLSLAAVGRLRIDVRQLTPRQLRVLFGLNDTTCTRCVCGFSRFVNSRMFDPEGVADMATFRAFCMAHVLSVRNDLCAAAHFHFLDRLEWLQMFTTPSGMTPSQQSVQDSAKDTAIVVVDLSDTVVDSGADPADDRIRSIFSLLVEQAREDALDGSEPVLIATHNTGNYTCCSPTGVLAGGCDPFNRSLVGCARDASSRTSNMSLLLSMECSTDLPQSLQNLATFCLAVPL